MYKLKYGDVSQILFSVRQIKYKNWTKLNLLLWMNFRSKTDILEGNLSI